MVHFLITKWYTFQLLYTVLCAGSFWFGTQQRQEAIVESTETQVEIDTTRYDTPAPPIKVTPTPNIVVEKLPIVNYEKLREQIVDSLIAIGYSQKDVDKIAPIAIPDSIESGVPITQSIFKEEGVYEIGVTGYKNSLDYVQLFNRTTTTTNTIKAPIKPWSLNAGINSFTSQGVTDLSVQLGVEYTKSNLTVGGGYQVSANGTSGFFLDATYTIWTF